MQLIALFIYFFMQTKWFWHYSEITEKLEASIHQLFIDIDKILERFINNIEKSSSSSNELASMLIVSPDYTSVEFSHELPVDWNSFKVYPNVEELPLLTDESLNVNDSSTIDK